MQIRDAMSVFRKRRAGDRGKDADRNFAVRGGGSAFDGVGQGGPRARSTPEVDPSALAPREIAASAWDARAMRAAASGAIVAILLWPRPALAGMPAPMTLNEIPRMRIEAISFFLLILALSAWMVQLLWNNLRGTFTRLPRLNYWRALSLATLWGLLFILVLVMISGARELMTPGAWEKQGATYRLTEGRK